VAQAPKISLSIWKLYGAELRPGQIVQVRYGKGEKGLMAAELRPDGAVGYPSSH
jgi:CspA family cold shock protein